MWRVFGGAALAVAGIAAFIEASANAPGFECAREQLEPTRFCEGTVAAGWSHSTYNAVRIGGWALLIFGALLIVVGLIAYARRPRVA